MKTPCIGIDLGASYTKVAFRLPLHRHGRGKFATATSKIAVVQGSATIPSVMVQTGDRGQPWAAGRDAAGMTPGRGMRVFENWKSALYSSSFDAGKVELVWVAGNFFKWLLDRLVNTGIVIEDDLCIRVTIPSLKRIEDQKDALLQCMRLNGWPQRLEVVPEPTANLIGVLSGGRNVVTAAGHISYQPTFGNADGSGPAELRHVFEEIRNHAFGSRRSRHMRVSVVDCGSFTLDIATLALDLKVVDYETFPVERVDSKSWEVGVIEDIDRPCLTALLSRHGLDASKISFEVKERTKAALYRGDAYAPLKGRVTLGETAHDKEVVSDAIRNYCEKAWSRISDECRDSEVVVLTGGGTCIPGVREILHQKLTLAGVSNVIDFKSATATHPDAKGHGELQVWQEAGDGLGRLATALGATSIGLGFVPDDVCKSFVPRGAPL